MNVTLSSISIESGNKYFVIENELLIDVIHHTMIRNFSKSSQIEIQSRVEIVGSSCFSSCESLSSISFESNLRLSRIESHAFANSFLQTIGLPGSIAWIHGSTFLDTE
jgi:hypothetical protein